MIRRLFRSYTRRVVDAVSAYDSEVKCWRVISAMGGGVYVVDANRDFGINPSRRVMKNVEFLKAHFRELEEANHFIRFAGMKVAIRSFLL